jgi:squalene synthase HpnC
MLLAGEPPRAPSAAAVMERAGQENFSVASRALPRRVRGHLLAIYGFARLVDQLGDAAPGDRLAALDELQADLERAFTGRPEHPLLVRLQPTIAACGLPREPFIRLIDANRMDQRVSRYRTWGELRAYCALSADPVGELVLRVFGLDSPERITLSDSICTALQLTEHCQDVAEDLAAGRVYLPLEDLERFGCTVAELSHDHAGERLRAVIAFEVERARGLLAAGTPLLGELSGRPRLAVAGFIAGGEAALEAIERAGYDVLAGAPTAGTPRRLLALCRLLTGRLRAAGATVAE